MYGIWVAVVSLWGFVGSFSMMTAMRCYLHHILSVAESSLNIIRLGLNEYMELTRKILFHSLTYNMIVFTLDTYPALISDLFI